ncbi:MAG: ribosomal-protein-alanine N-acetyltransferase [Deltaproteobacteria bacterium]|nr:MAG: ribosomal-protein-alanine N-acetyltransferase [Deltaproteobacteria bacterium]
MPNETATGESCLIRKMSIADIPRMVQLETAEFHRPWKDASFREELTLSAPYCLIAECAAPAFFDSDTTITGYLCARLMYDELHIVKILTAPGHQRKGIAGQLLDKVLGIGLKQGARISTLEVRASNIPAIRCYERAGFQTVGTRSGYYADTNEDALIMTVYMNAQN